MGKYQRQILVDYVEADLRVAVYDFPEASAVFVDINDETDEQPFIEMRLTYAQFRALAAAITEAQRDTRLA